ncbi:MAG TPA: hypothetical protein DCM28_14960 [Phycisphaerales bacterium]|nr:hypothetical protein [Phycisphaerales bacterium]HCD33388.1 hypothetical protein [Phycisphaerales bacterium]
MDIFFKIGISMASRYDEIRDSLRSEIISGKISPGQTIPTRVAIQQQYGAGPMTVNRALIDLQDDGFLEARRGQGTRVVDYPPHLYNYQLAFGNHPNVGEEMWPRFYNVLVQAAATMDAKGPLRMKCLYGVDGHVDSDGMAQLSRLVESQRTAGIIFASSPHKLEESGLLDRTDIPKVAFRTGRGTVGHYSTIALDMSSFVEKALDHLATLNCKRLAVLTVGGLIERYSQQLMHGAKARGMEMQPYWNLLMSQKEAHSAANITHLLFNPSQTKRPDALIIMDDNLVEHATSGLIAAGVTDQVKVVAHCNFPWPAPSPISIRRLGFDGPQALKFSLSQLDLLREGHQPTHHDLKPVFEDEVSVYS